MCNFCKMEVVNKRESSNKHRPIMGIKDGSQLFELSMNRYKVDNHKSNNLVVDLCMMIGNDVYPIKTKEIDIKYCPFCGEEL